MFVNSVNVYVYCTAGDLWSYNTENDSYVVSPEPDISVYELDPHQQRCLILATDGVWNMVSPTDAIDCVWSSACSLVGLLAVENYNRQL